MDPQTKNPAIAALTAITKMASTANPAAGVGVGFYVEESMQNIKKSLCDNSLWVSQAEVKACRQLLRQQSLMSKLS